MAELKKIGENTVKIDVEVPAEEVHAKAAEVYAELSRKVKVPGFRKGKIPPRVLKRNYADYVLQTIVDELVPVAFERVEAELGVNAVESPRYEVKAVSEDGPLSFTAEVAVFPEITLPDYAKFIIKRDRPEVKDEDVERALDNVREVNARLEPVEERGALDGELVVLKFLDPKPPEGFTRPTVGVWASADDAGDAFGRQVLGKAPGGTFALAIDYPADYPSKRYAGKEVQAPVEVTAVKKRVLPELDDDFAKDVGEESLDALRAKVRGRLEERAEEMSYVVAYRRLLDDIAARAVVPMDDSFVEKFVPAGEGDAAPEEGKSGKDLEETRRELSRYFIVRELARREGVEVTAEDVREAMTASASETGAPPERPAEVYDRVLNEKLAARLVPREAAAGGS
jgi:trigger factor